MPETQEDFQSKPVMFSLDSLMSGNSSSYNTISRKEKINMVKDTIHLLTSVKNAGVMEGEGITHAYKSLFMNEMYVYQLEDHIMDLSKLLVQETKALFKNGKTK